MAYHLTHPDSDLEIEVEAEQVSLYTGQGWKTKAGAKKAATGARSQPRSRTAPESPEPN